MSGIVTTPPPATATKGARGHPWRFLLLVLACPAGVVLAYGLRALWAWRRPPWWLPPLLLVATLAGVQTLWLTPRALTWRAVFAQYGEAHRHALADVGRQLAGRGREAASALADATAPEDAAGDTTGQETPDTPGPIAAVLVRVRAAATTLETRLPPPVRAALPRLEGTPAPDVRGVAWGYLRATWPLWLPAGVLLATVQTLRAAWALRTGVGAGSGVPGSPVPGRFPLGNTPGNGNAGTASPAQRAQAAAQATEAALAADRLVAVHAPRGGWFGRRGPGQGSNGTDLARRDVVAGVLPAGHVALVYGDAGLGKSTVALWLALCVAAGLPVFGRAVRRMPAVFVDAELDEATFRQRATEMAVGLGLPGGRPPRGLYYRRCEAPLTDAATIPALAADVWAALPWWTRRVPKWVPAWLVGDRSVLVCYDSLTIGGGLGVSAGDAAVTTALRRIRRHWLLPGGHGAVLCVDHVPKLPAGQRNAWRQQLPFASAAKKFHTRSMLVVGPPDAQDRRAGAVVELSHHKFNFGPLFGSILLGAERGLDREGRTLLRYRVVEERAPAQPQYDAIDETVDVDAAEGKTPAAAETETVPEPPAEPVGPPVLERYLTALASCGPAGATREELAAAVQASAKTASNRLSELHKAGRVERSAAGRWYLPEHLPEHLPVEPMDDAPSSAGEGEAA